MIDDTAIDRFNEHRDGCAQCFENQFQPCPAGAALLDEIAGPLPEEED